MIRSQNTNRTIARHVDSVCARELENLSLGYYYYYLLFFRGVSNRHDSHEKKSKKPVEIRFPGQPWRDVEESVHHVPADL